MRWLLVSMLLVLSFELQATPATFYRALKHLGFDNKRIAKIVIGIKESAKNGEVFSLVTKKHKDTTNGYRFFQKESGELVMEKFEVRSGIPKIGNKETIDPNLADYQLAISELTGLTGKQAKETELLLRKGRVLDLKLSKDELVDHAGIILQVDNGRLVQQQYLVLDGVKEFADQELVDFAMLRNRKTRQNQQLAEQKISFQQRLTQLLTGIIDHNNNRKVADVVNDLKQLPPAEVKPPAVEAKTVVDNTQTSTLSSLLTDNSLTKKKRASLLMEDRKSVV